MKWINLIFAVQVANVCLLIVLLVLTVRGNKQTILTFRAKKQSTRARKLALLEGGGILPPPSLKPGV